MKIYSWNVNGLRAIVKKNFNEFINDEQPDILCIQETKIDEKQLNESLISIENYKSFFSFAEKKGYSGVGTYSKLTPEYIKHGFGNQKFDSEGRILITGFSEFTLLNIYFPNGQMSEERLKYKMDFYDYVLENCNDLVSKGEKLVICGDYNVAHNEIDIKNAKANEKVSGFLKIEREWMDKLIENGYTDTFRYMCPDKIKYSWWSYKFKARERNAGWRIDYFFVSNNLLSSVKNVNILNDIYGSDHCPIMLEIE